MALAENIRGNGDQFADNGFDRSTTERDNWLDVFNRIASRSSEPPGSGRRRGGTDVEAGGGCRQFLRHRRKPTEILMPARDLNTPQRLHFM